MEGWAGKPRLRRRFETLLGVAQGYAVVREEQAGCFTLGWPVLRRGALRLGDELCRRGVIERTEDVFFLTRAELEASLQASSVERSDGAGAGGHDTRHTHETSHLRPGVAARQQEGRRHPRPPPPPPPRTPPRSHLHR